MTALHIAAVRGDSKNVERLLKAGAHVNALTYWGRSPLHCAAYRNDKNGRYKETMDLLYDAHALVDQEDYCGATPLIMAIRGSCTIKGDDGAFINNADLVEWLLQHNANVNKVSGNQTPLLAAVNKNDLAMVELLLKYGAQIDLKNVWGCTALDVAISNGFEAIQRYLISKGAHYTFGKRFLEALQPERKWILYPLHEAADAGCLDRLQTLLSSSSSLFSCSVDGIDDVDRTALHYAANKDFDEIVLFLISEGSSMQKKDSEGKMPLESAVESGALKCVKCFLAQHGVDTYLKNATDKGDTIGAHLLDIAAINGYEDIVLELRKHGAKVLGNSLIWAVNNDLLNVAREILMEDKAEDLLQGKDSYGRSALDIAVEKRNAEMIRILLQAGAPTGMFLPYLNRLKAEVVQTRDEAQAEAGGKKPSLDEIERLFNDLTDIESIVAKHRSFNENDEKDNVLDLQDPEIKELGMHGFIKASLQHFRGERYTQNYSGYYALFNAINPFGAHDSNRREQFAEFLKASLTYIKRLGINPPYDNLLAQHLWFLLEGIKRNPQEFGIGSTDILEKIVILSSENLNALLKGEQRLEEAFDEKALDAFSRFTSGKITCLSLIVSDRLQKDWFSITAYNKENAISLNIYHSGLKINQWNEQLLDNIPKL
jgi:ankyrin repeat protein